MMNPYLLAAILTPIVIFTGRWALSKRDSIDGGAHTFSTRRLQMEGWALTAAFFVPLVVGILALRGALPDDQLFSLGLVFSGMVALPAAIVLVGTSRREEGWLNALLVQMSRDSGMTPGAGRVLVAVIFVLGVFALLASLPAYFSWRAGVQSVVG